MPKCSTRPYQSPGHSAVAACGGRKLGSPFGVVRLDSARSALPPQSSGRRRHERVDHCTGGLAGRHVLARPRTSAARRPSRREARCSSMRARSSAPPGFASLPGAEPGLPLLVRGRPALAQSADVIEHLVGHLERLVRVEAEDLLGGGDFFGAERRPVRLAGVLGLRCGPRDDRLQRDEGRPLGLGLRGEQRGVEALDVLLVVGSAVRPVDALHVPAVRLVPRGDVLGQRDVGVALDRDLVLVVDDDEVAELLAAGDRAGLAGDALLHVAVGGEHPDRVVERRVADRRDQGRAGHARAALPSPCRRRSRGPGRAVRS